MAVGASVSRGDLSGRYAEHQHQASQLRSEIHADTTAIQSYEGSISALQARLAIVQRRLDVDEGLLAQVRLELTRAWDRVAELKVQYARDRRLLAAIEVRRDRSAAAVLAERNQIVQLRLSIVDRELASAHDRASKRRQLSALQRTLSHEESVLQRQAASAAAAAFGSERLPVKTTSGSYIDPLQFVNLWERTDQGVDATMPVGAPILAPTQVKILAIEPDWYLGQPPVYWELLAGPDAGMEQYVAEEITDIAPPGSILQQGQVIARYAASGTGIEYGWSTPDGVTLARASRWSAALLLSSQRGHPVGADCPAEDDRYRTNPATPAGSLPTTGIAPVAVSGAHATACRVGRLRRHGRRPRSRRRRSAVLGRRVRSGRDARSCRGAGLATYGILRRLV